MLFTIGWLDYLRYVLFIFTGFFLFIFFISSWRIVYRWIVEFPSPLFSPPNSKIFAHFKICFIPITRSSNSTFRFLFQIAIKTNKIQSQNFDSSNFKFAHSKMNRLFRIDFEQKLVYDRYSSIFKCAPKNAFNFHVGIFNGNADLVN